MKLLLAILALSLSACRGFVTSISLGLSHKETRLDATWHFSGKETVSAKSPKPTL